MNAAAAKRVLNVGGNSKAIPLPPIYAGWEHVLLDIDPAGKPDIVCDARNMYDLPGASFDAIYCSHNLEHYFLHDAVDVVLGFLHVLRDDGFIEIRVPDVGELMRLVAQNNWDISDTVYVSMLGPISVRDMLYGFQKQIEQSGNDFFAHKNGFTRESLTELLTECGFKHCFVSTADIEIVVYAFKQPPNAYARELLHLEKMEGK
jgi:SAM-dependent methyltransferase